MKTKLPFSFIEATPNNPIVFAILQAGIVARMMQGKVANDGKQDDTNLPGDNDALRTQRAAKTVVDVIVQELLLQAIQRVINPQEVGLDAEEKTPAAAIFLERGKSSLTIVIDPIDETLQYLRGKDSYSVCVGLCENGRMKSCAIYFPEKRRLYCRTDSGVSAMYTIETKKLTPLKAPRNQVPKVVYKNGRVPEPVLERLKAAGFTVLDDLHEQIGVSGAMLACLDGKAAAYICHTRNVRDVLMGPIIASLDSGFAVDWQGKTLQWPAGGRVARTVFGANSTYKDEIISCLKEE